MRRCRVGRRRSNTFRSRFTPTTSSAPCGNASRSASRAARAVGACASGTTRIVFAEKKAPCTFVGSVSPSTARTLRRRQVAGRRRGGPAGGAPSDGGVGVEKAAGGLERRVTEHSGHTSWETVKLGV
jgi:hypothetical protein